MAITPQASKAMEYLRSQMDRYMSFGVYADEYSVGNHFEPSGWMGDASNAIKLSIGSTKTWYSGGNSVEIKYYGTGTEGWAGIYWLDPKNNWGAKPKGGFNLSGVERLTFKVRGLKGGEKASFGVGGVEGVYGDTIYPAVKTTCGGALSSTWKTCSLDLRGLNLNRVVGGFRFIITKWENPKGATIFLDDIRFEQHKNKLRLIESYTNDTGFVPPKPMQTHKYLYVYGDGESEKNSFFNNGFYESGWMGDYGDLKVNMNDPNKYDGTSAMRWDYSGQRSQEQGWAGVYWQAPAYAWGDRIGGYNLAGACCLTFWARGETGTEQISGGGFN